MIDNLDLVALGAPSPPEELVAVGAAHDGREAVVAGVSALSLGDVDVKGEPFVFVGIDGVGRAGTSHGCGRFGREIDRIGGCRCCCVDRLHIFEFDFEVFDELGIGEVEFLQLVIFSLKGVEHSDIEGIPHVSELYIVVEIGNVVALSVEVGSKLLALVD